MKTRDKLHVAAIVSVMAALFCGLCYYEYSMWTECRQTNSFWYCLRVLDNGK